MNAAFGNQNIQWSIVGTAGDQESILVLLPDSDEPLHADSHGNPKYAEIKALLNDGGPDDIFHFVGLFDVAKIAAEKFAGALSERIAVRHGRVYLDGDEIDSTLTRQIIRFVHEDVEDWRGLVAFMEKVLVNPLPEAQQNLYGWMQRHNITITQDGDLVLYKGVCIAETDEDGPVFTPTTRGEGIVNDVIENDRQSYTRFRVGDTVSIRRSTINWTPYAACGSGLHVGSRTFASGYGHGALLRVIVNPRDVVNVPTSEDKLRVCRYRVLDVIENGGFTHEDDQALPATFQVPTSDPGTPAYHEPEGTAAEPQDTLNETLAAPLAALAPREEEQDDIEPEEYDCDSCEDSGCEDCEPDEEPEPRAIAPGERVDGLRVLADDGNEGTVVEGPSPDGEYLVDFDGIGREWAFREELALLP